MAQEPVAAPTSQFGGVVTCEVHSSVDIVHAHTVGISLRVVRLHPSNQVQTKQTPFSVVCLALLQHSDSQTAIQMSADSSKCINLETPAHLTTALEIQ